MFKISIEKKSKSEVLIDEIIDKAKEFDEAANNPVLDNTGIILGVYKDSKNVLIAKCNGSFLFSFILETLKQLPFEMVTDIISEFKNWQVNGDNEPCSK